MIGSSDDGLLAELAFARAKCSPDAAAARDYYRQTAQFAHGVDPFNEANALLYLGFFLLQDKHYEEAINRYSDALALADSFLLLKEKALGNLGYAYQQIGEYRRAIFFSQQAEQLAVDINNPQDQMRWLIDLGREYFHEQQNSKANASFGKALLLSRDLQDDADTALCLHDLTQMAFQIKDPDKAETYIHQLGELKPVGARYLDLLLDRAELATVRKDFPLAERLLSQVLEGSPGQQGIDPDTVWTAQSDLASVFTAQGKFAQAETMFRAAVGSAETTRSKIGGIQYRISFLDYNPFYDEYVRFLVSRNRPLEALAIAEQGRSPTLSEGFPSKSRSTRVNIERLQRVLQQQKRVVLAYWLAEDESYVWVITPTQVKLIRLPPELDIEREIELYNRQIIDGGTLENSQHGETLYKMLVSPAEPCLPKDWGVIIVPHRKLYNLNFETLVVPGPTPHYWIDDVASHNVSFLSALTISRPGSAPSKELLLVGAPLLADKQFPVLKHAPAEMEKVAAHFPAARESVISGKDATPAAYLTSQPGQFRLIHFVTHGTSSTVLENPLDSAIILSSASAASAADPEGSYHLYGKDIMKTPLHADLVTVSACYGLGREYSGEGLVGLAWAFLRAGAHQVIAALWEVDDASTPQLMDDFYGEYTHGKTAADALRDAKLRMLHSNDFHKRPYYWASLQLYTGS